MNIRIKAMGVYLTNCYIVTVDKKDIIIDPGVNAVEWIKKKVKNPVAILNTHGHFDHIWSNAKVKKELKVPIYTPQDDAFMLEKDPFSHGTPLSKADVLVKPDEELKINGIKVKFHHFPGHTPGNSAIEIGDALFSGDFIFKDSIGRVDFPFSSRDDMIESIKKFIKTYNKNDKIYPGHGGSTTVNQAKKMLEVWLDYL